MVEPLLINARHPKSVTKRIADRGIQRPAVTPGEGISVLTLTEIL
jgi:hypothetical protein